MAWRHRHGRGSPLPAIRGTEPDDDPREIETMQTSRPRRRHSSLHPLYQLMNLFAQLVPAGKTQPSQASLSRPSIDDGKPIDPASVARCGGHRAMGRIEDRWNPGARGPCLIRRAVIPEGRCICRATRSRSNRPTKNDPVSSRKLGQSSVRVDLKPISGRPIAACVGVATAGNAFWHGDVSPNYEPDHSFTAHRGKYAVSFPPRAMRVDDAGDFVPDRARRR